MRMYKIIMIFKMKIRSELYAYQLSFQKGEKKEIEYTGSPEVETMKEFLEGQTGHVAPEKVAQNSGETKEEKPENLDKEPKEAKEPEMGEKIRETHGEL